MESVNQDIKYSLPFVVNEKDNKVIFNSKDEKKNYLKNEKQFCLKENEAYVCQFDVETRKLLKIDLEKKRMAFAIHSGFQEIRKTGTWKHIVNNDVKELA